MLKTVLLGLFLPSKVKSDHLGGYNYYQASEPANQATDDVLSDNYIRNYLASNKNNRGSGATYQQLADTYNDWRQSYYNTQNQAAAADQSVSYGQNYQSTNTGFDPAKYASSYNLASSDNSYDTSYPSYTQPFAESQPESSFDPNHDCFQNITERINNFFYDKFPKLPNGQSSYNPIEILDNYGCWCRRNSGFGSGLGQPRDAYDAICKFHHQGYECIEVDAEDRGEVCDPVAISNEGFRFKLELSFYKNRGALNIACDTNQSWCHQRVCEMDIQYIKDFLRTSLAGHVCRKDLYGHADLIDPGTGLPYGYFEAEESCPIGGSLHMPYKQCCGAYPRRIVYKTDSLSDESYRSCCDLENGDNDGSTDGQIFYPASQICCGEQGVQSGETCQFYEAL